MQFLGVYDKVYKNYKYKTELQLKVNKKNEKFIQNNKINGTKHVLDVFTGMHQES